VFSEIVGFTSLDRPLVTIDGQVDPSRQVDQVSDDFFLNLGVVPIVGRVPERSDGTAAFISYRLWRDRLGSSPSVLGRTLTIDGQVSLSVGVAPPGFFGLSIDNPVDLWISSPTAESQRMIARLRPGVTSAQAQAVVQLLFRQFASARPELVPDVPMQIELLPAGRGLSQFRAQYERPLQALVVLVALLLLITCTNVGNLLLVRNVARKRELTVRVALGASRARLMLQYLVESAMLATLGGIVALVVARWGVSILLSMLPLPPPCESLAFHAHARIVGFAAGLSLLSALLCGLAPAWRATHVDLTDALRLSQGSKPTKGTRRLGHLLVACQVALSVLLLVGAGLFVQTLRNLARVDVGFNPDGLLQVSVDPRASGYVRWQVGG